MEVMWSLFGTLLGAIVGAWLGIAWSQKHIVEPLEESRDFWVTQALGGKRVAILDSQVTWKLDELTRKVQTWDGD